MKNYFLLFLSLSTTFLFAQKDSEADYYMTKDSKKLGKRAEMNLGFINSFSKKQIEKYDNMMDLAECYYTTICENLDLKTIRKLYKSGSKWNFGKKMELQDSIERKIGNCFWNHMTDKGKEDYEKKWTKLCIKDIKKNKLYKDYSVDPAKMCSCLKESFEKKEYNILASPNFTNEYGEGTNEFYFPCLAGLAKESKIVEKKQKENLEDIEGAESQCKIQTIKAFEINKVKIIIDSVAYYFIIDTGASDVQISNDLYKKWKKLGIIQEVNYINTRNYTIANNEKQKCKRYLVHHWQIGSYTVNNIVISVSPEKHAPLLLGKSFINLFKTWNMDNSSMLTITK